MIKRLLAGAALALGLAGSALATTPQAVTICNPSGNNCGNGNDNATYASQVPISAAGVPVAPGRALFINVSVAGELDLVLPDYSVVPYLATATGTYTLPFAVKQIATTSTAQFTYAANLP